MYSISGEPNLTAKYSRRNRTTIHWILNTLGISLIACGFIIVFINKVNLDKPHFATTHGILGLTTIILVCLVALFGIVANNTQWLYPKVRPVILKVAHAFGGIAITILLLVTLSNGTYRHWWPGSEVGRGLVITAFVLSALLILTKPILGAVSRSRLIFQRPASSTSSWTFCDFKKKWLLYIRNLSEFIIYIFFQSRNKVKKKCCSSINVINMKCALVGCLNASV